MLRRVLVVIAVSGCPSSRPPAKPVKPQPVKVEPPPAPVETEEDREGKRLAAAHAIVPPATTCIPVALHRKAAPRLELAAIGSDAILCAYDTQRNRLLGPVACWKIELSSGELEYRDPAPLPAIGFAVRIEDTCVRGLCLPEDTAPPADKVAHLAYSTDGTKVAMLASDQVSLYDARSKTREAGFSVKGIGQVTGLYLVDDTVFVEAGEDGKRRAFMFKTDGTKLGAVNDDKDQPLIDGAFSVLDASRVAIAEPGWSALIVLDTATGKKTRIARKLPRSPCTAAETSAYWAGGDDVSEKCNKYMVKTFDYLVGATAVAGARNLLVVLRNGRLGELGVLDAATLAEKNRINLPWCEDEAPSDE